ncbi:MAG: hypothetical protein ACM3N4_07045 [Nitrososphaerota archaeon]
MSYEPGKRRLKWFPKLNAGAVGRFWQRVRPRGKGSRGWQPGKRATANTPFSSQLGGQQPPHWDPVAPGGANFSSRSPRALWQRFRPGSRRQQVGLAVSAGVLVFASLFGITLLCTHVLANATNTPTGGAHGNTASGANASGTATASSTTATPLPPFTITFTCASGAIKRTGKVCVHTQPNAILTLSVRYCDGTLAGGRGLHTSASADDSGDFSWEFAVHTRCAGEATATVVAKSAGQTVTQSTTFNVTR